jgi:hypothetical protein
MLELPIEEGYAQKEYKLEVTQNTHRVRDKKNSATISQY